MQRSKISRFEEVGTFLAVCVYVSFALESSVQYNGLFLYEFTTKRQVSKHNKGFQYMTERKTFFSTVKLVGLAQFIKFYFFPYRET